MRMEQTVRNTPVSSGRLWSLLLLLVYRADEQLIKKKNSNDMALLSAGGAACEIYRALQPCRVRCHSTDRYVVVVASSDVNEREASSIAVAVVV